MNLAQDEFRGVLVRLLGGGCAYEASYDIISELCPEKRTVNKVAAYHTSGAEGGVSLFSSCFTQKRKR